MKIPFVGPSYQSRSLNFDAQRCVNLYPEVSESGTGKNVAMLVGTPGLELWLQLPVTDAVRGMIVVDPETAIVVVGYHVYRVDNLANYSAIGTIANGSNRVSMAYNGSVVMLVDGTTNGWVIDPVAGTTTRITDPDFTGGDRVAFIDGYFVWNCIGTGRFQITGLYSTTFNALDFATAEGSPDNLLSLINDHRELWLFGENTTEVFYNSGNPDFPFDRIQGAFLEYGTCAKDSVAKIDNSVFWLSANDQGQGQVIRAQGYTPQRISTHAIEYAIGQYRKNSRIDDAIAYSYQQEGHNFYVLTFPTANATWVFDTVTSMWHERAYRDSLGVLNRHRSNCQMAFAGLTIVGDHSNGKLYSMDLDVYSDDGDVIPAIRQTPHQDDGGRFRQFFSRFWLDMETGVGLSSGQGSAPVALLDWSDDGGHTWSNQHQASIGALGARRTRAVWRQLGKSYDRVWRVTITDPVKRCLINADVEFKVGG